ncbi:MAG: sugar synthetase [Trueperaceae bacterium]|nr:sugar synthetase [Trueperaceae bacterium]
MTPPSAPNRQVVLVSNGPGELLTWVRPTLDTLRRLDPDVRVAIALIPCQFAGGSESTLAATFGADAVTTPQEYVRAAATGRAPAALQGADRGVVVSMGGNGALAVSLARRLRVPAVRYSFVPYFARGLERLFVHDDATRRKARLFGASADRVEVVGNLVADAVHAAPPIANAGSPHVLLLAGSRDAFAVHLIPFMIALADQLAPRYPGARFVWPVSRLLREATIDAGIAGVEAGTLGGVAGRRDGDRVHAPHGAVVEMVPEGERHAHMRAATIAVTIPGTNTLELGIAGVPSVVMLPLNRPEVIPLEGPGHWLSLLPVVGTALKRNAVRLFVERLRYPISLPNQFSREALMVELKGVVDPSGVAAAAAALIDDTNDLARRRARLLATMPGPGAAERLVRRIYHDAGWEAPPLGVAAPADARAPGE